jgi:fumarate hydratase class II
VIIFNVLQSARLLGDAAESFALHCIAGIRADRGRLEELLQRSLMLVTALNPHIGYDKASKIARKAHLEGLSLKEAALKLGFLDEKTFDRLVQPETMLAPQPLRGGKKRSGK